MGNYRFRLSDLVSSSWFYKLKDISNKPRNHNTTTNKKQTAKYTNSQLPKPDQQQFHYTSYARKSYHINRELNPTTHSSPLRDPPRKSSKQTINKKKIRTPRSAISSVSASCSCRATLWTKSDSPADSSLSPDSDSAPESDLEVSNQRHSNANVVDKEVIVKETDRIRVYDKISDFDLPPIITKPVNNKIAKNVGEEHIKIKSNSTRYERNANTHGSLPSQVKTVKEQNKSTASQAKKHSANSPGVRLRTNSPRIGTRKCYQGRRSLSSGTSSRRWSRSVRDSLAIVKSSFDPQSDFKESMMEMINENNIRASKDLEELLACYLSLNSDEYHHVIIKVFKQIWFDVTRN